LIFAAAESDALRSLEVEEAEDDAACRPTDKLEYTQKEGIISGLPCSSSKVRDFWWPDTFAERFTMPKPKEENIEGLDSSSMLCVTLMLAYSEEQEILKDQYRNKVGIFQCDKYAVYSAQVIKIGEHFTTRNIHHSMVLEKGGRYNTGLDVAIFRAMWRAIILDDEYRHVSWTIKLDPDSVFFPYRLAPLLPQYADHLSEPGLYLNNCRYGMHGPIEVLSQNAVRTLAQVTVLCYAQFTGGCHFDCYAPEEGEDIWLDSCLSRFTKVKRIYNWHLLSEAACSQPWYKWCETDTVVFHPFKDTPGWMACHKRAEAKYNHSRFHFNRTKVFVNHTGHHTKVSAI